MAFNPSELILNPDGSIYHLNLKPENIAQTIITVGDPDRVDAVTSFFDSVEFKIRKREFHTQTGIYKGKRITVISTGIGTDNIDIVFNELDALVNIDFQSGKIKEQLTKLDFVRIGTSGSIAENIPINSFLLSETAIGFDALLHYYKLENIQNKAVAASIAEQLPFVTPPYVVDGDAELKTIFQGKEIQLGITATNCGFYAPQGRELRAPRKVDNLIGKLKSVRLEGKQITNLEMETSGIYGMAKLLGHRAVSMNAILANRVTGEFSENPAETTEKLILFCLDKISQTR